MDHPDRLLLGLDQSGHIDALVALSLMDRKGM